MFRKIICAVFSAVLLAAVAGCGTAKQNDSQMTEILRDTKFEKGFGAMGITSANGYNVKRELLIDEDKPEYDWLIAQWATQHSFEQEMERVETDGEISFQNEAKQVIVTPGKGKLQLNAYASKEYTAPRTASEPWIHLLLEQVFKDTSLRIGLCLDTAWALDSREDPVQTAEKFKDRLYSLHLKDFVFDRAAAPHDVVLGEGNLKLKSLLEAMGGISFAGDYIIEYEGDAGNPVPALKKCVEAVMANAD